MSKPKTSNKFRLYVRHYCDTCGSRIFPFDKFENRTEVISTKNGTKQRILLYSSNNRDVNIRRAWCWSCDGFRMCTRLTEDKILQLYIQRKGIMIRDKTR